MALAQDRQRYHQLIERQSELGASVSQIRADSPFLASDSVFSTLFTLHFSILFYHIFRISPTTWPYERMNDRTAVCADNLLEDFAEVVNVLY